MGGWSAHSSGDYVLSGRPKAYRLLRLGVNPAQQQTCSGKESATDN